MALRLPPGRPHRRPFRFPLPDVMTRKGPTAMSPVLTRRSLTTTLAGVA
ncbi:hypothetical protein GTY88_32105, partial [Streptomyces sp. SID5926]|nr:hypothetical protein [Streptomyces sp. SID5926]